MRMGLKRVERDNTWSHDAFTASWLAYPGPRGYHGSNLSGSPLIQYELSGADADLQVSDLLIHLERCAEPCTCIDCRATFRNLGPTVRGSVRKAKGSHRPRQ